jgi:hypothetical protein
MESEHSLPADAFFIDENLENVPSSSLPWYAALHYTEDTEKDDLYSFCESW